MSTIDKLYNDHGQSNDAKNNATNVEIPYLVTGVESVQEAIDAIVVSEDVPKTHGNLSVTGYDFDELPASGAYKIVVKYGSTSPASSASWSSDDDADSKPEITIDIGANSDTRKHCLKRVKAMGIKSESTPADIINKTAINVDADGNVNGCTVLTGYQTRSEVFYVNPDRLTTSYEKALGKLVGSINVKSFRSYPSGEVRFDGANYTYRIGQKENVKVTFKYSISPNMFKKKVAGVEVDKKGWDYVWVKYITDTEDGEPVADYLVVDQVSPYDDFGKLGIGK